MVQIHGLWWPDDVGTKWEHSLRHVKSLEWAIAHCPRKRTAVQAGGNIGLWPARLAKSFTRVITFEPDQISRECLLRNVPGSVVVMPEALGMAPGVCDIKHRSLGSHTVIPGDAVTMTTLDALGLEDVDLLQLDIEGYEMKALRGAHRTIECSHPLIQVELRDFGLKYGDSDGAVKAFLNGLGYSVVSKQPGNDVVFAWGQN